jgi:hypothetical protein
MITTGVYGDVRERATALGCTLSNGLTFLPDNLERVATADDLVVRGEVTTLRKVLTHGGVPSTVLAGDSARSPGFVHNKSHDWAVPVIFVSAELMKTSPDMIGLAIDLIRDYAVSLFKGVGADRSVKAEIVVELTEDGTFQKITYEGAAEGLSEITKMVATIHAQDNSRHC